jgi:hypothetical protein
MQWSEVIAPPPRRTLRQFAGLFLIVFLALAGWRVWKGHPDTIAAVLAGLAVVVGVTGMALPGAIRYLYTGWMIVAFPIGWTVSHLVLGAMYYLMFTPVAFVFRLTGRDELRVRRQDRTSYWVPKEQPASVREYFRQF